MQNGLYKVEFHTPQGGMGAGVVFAQDGKMFGGDSGIYYIGIYRAEGGRMQAQVHIDRHSDTGTLSVFGKDRVTIDIVGTYDGQSNINCTGTSPQAPGVPFTAELHMLPS
ncbi:GrlR family regulatory protein [Phyllobacterium sp. YR531]|uniref:GrlR family regulatory protein n=1 Tax=Phyllobacterium sp. YR531 TaxID=1144343 RepID=UPI00026F5B61|nr:GrlR family regulatory protein [Phyllobacterium sp. YR531]EJN04485.1 hypothetical protein PMI41_02126 [Phyllobacterium sp. YR531]